VQSELEVVACHIPGLDRIRLREVSTPCGSRAVVHLYIEVVKDCPGAFGLGPAFYPDELSRFRAAREEESTPKEGIGSVSLWFWVVERRTQDLVILPVELLAVCAMVRKRKLAFVRGLPVEQ